MSTDPKKLMTVSDEDKRALDLGRRMLAAVGNLADKLVTQIETVDVAASAGQALANELELACRVEVQRNTKWSVQTAFADPRIKDRLAEIATHLVANGLGSMTIRGKPPAMPTHAERVLRIEAERVLNWIRESYMDADSSQLNELLLKSQLKISAYFQRKAIELGEDAQ